MPKIYLSPAAHIHDNSTACPMSCSENTHCNQYMDIVESRLKELGFEVKRGDKSLTGSKAMEARVSEANAWRADIYYVAHTNAGGGRYSMTMCWNDAKSIAKANVFHKYRKSIKTHKVKPRTDLYEIRATAMTCLYDELFFHDNAEDCAWFHNGGMQIMAEEAVQALCEICSVSYKPHEQKEEKPNKTNQIKEWQNAAIADGYKFPKYGADGKWGSECKSVAKKAICKKRLIYQNKHLTKIVQTAVGVKSDGLFGNGTKNAVIAYQKMNGLTPDGIVGLNTWKKILGV